LELVSDLTTDASLPPYEDLLHAEASPHSCGVITAQIL
jgi:hypothetical protein